MIFLLLSVLSSAAVALVLKLASQRSVARFPLFTVNYATALVLGLLLSHAGALAEEPPAAIGIALASGALYVLGFLVFRRAIAETSAGIAASVSRLSVAGPIVLSVLVFGESMGVPQAGGIVLAIVALPLSGRIWPPWSRGLPVAPPAGEPSSARDEHDRHLASGVLWAAALFVIFAVNDGVLKVRTELLPGSDAGLFFAILFGSAGVISFVIAIVRRERPTREVLLGIPLGAANYGTAYFLSLALERMPGYEAFTLNSVGVILVVVVAGRVFFAERLARHNYVFLAASVAAIVLLRLPG
ncbi:MAG: EamA family transporter [Spirochaetota bacterium]